MKSLATLIKLQKTRVDEQRMLVARLQDQLASIEAGLAALRAQQEQQRVLVRELPEMALTYGEYVKTSLQQEALLMKKRRTAEMAVNAALDKLAELFEEQKRYELAERNRIEEEEREEARRETITLDEVGSIGFTRKKGKK